MRGDRVRGAWKRVRAVLFRGAVERELRDELDFHLALEIERNIASGMTAGAARRAAVRSFGGQDRWAEGVRDVRNFGGLEALVQDARQAWRGYQRAPGFALAAVVTLALGIGGATAVFGVVDAALLRPLPYPDAERLVHVWETNAEGADFSASEPNFVDFAAATRVLSGLAAYRLDAAVFGAAGGEQVRALNASHALLSLLGAEPALGRTWGVAEDRPGGVTNVAVLSDGFWRRRFGADPNALGATILLQGEPHTVIGVFAPDVRFVDADLWVPLAADAAGDRTDHWLGMIGRLAPGATVAQAQAELERIASNIGMAHPEVAGWGVRVEPLVDWLVEPPVRRAGTLLLAAVGFLLLMACANVANLLLARATTRQTDVGVRLALGAGRGRLVRQLLTESGLLVVAGAAAGVSAAWIALGALRGAAPAFIPRVTEIGIDARVLLCAVALTVLCTLLVGLLPALQASAIDLHSALKQTGRTGGSRAQRAVRESLVVAQVAIAVVLLVAGGLMMRSQLRLQAVDPGFATEHVWTVRLQPLDADYPEPWQRARFFNVVSDAVTAVPGVQAAGATVVDPFGGMNLVNGVTPEDRAASAPASGFMQAAWRVVTPTFFDAASIPVLRGRGFSFEEDRPEGDRNAVITQSLAERLWPGADPIGQRLFWGGTTGRPITVVGVVGDVRDVSLAEPPQPTMFLTSRQIGAFPWMVLVVRAGGDVAGLPAAIRTAILSVDPNIVIPEIRRVSESRAATIAQPRLVTLLLTAFAAIALTLATVGLYGVLAFGVAQRTREIGVRMALGASAATVLAMLVRRGLLLTGAGLAIGIAGATALARLLSSLLYETAWLDPLTFIGVPALFMFVALLATLVPARRAAGIDPSRGLKADG